MWKIVFHKALLVQFPAYRCRRKNTEFVGGPKSVRAIPPDAERHQILVGKSIVYASELRKQAGLRSEEHTSELQSLMRTSYAVFCWKKKKKTTTTKNIERQR